jgi:AcrR family transcriptional regulator
MAADGVLSLRERKKLRTRKELAETALRMFSERGFDQVTIEEIAAAVEVSPSTFLRYFERKEDVLLADDARRLDELTAALAARPSDEAVLDVVRHALAALADDIEADRDTITARARIMSDTPSLRARSLENQTRVEQALAQSIASRLDADRTELHVRLIAATSIAAFRIATEVWLAHDADQPLGHYVTDTLELLDNGLRAAVAQ